MEDQINRTNYIIYFILFFSQYVKIKQKSLNTVYPGKKLRNTGCLTCSKT